MAARDKKILIVFLGVIVLALSYFLGYRSLNEKRDALRAENVVLRDSYADLSMKAANADMYQKEMKVMNTKMEEIFTHFPSYLQIENEIMDAISLEKATKSTISSLSIADPVAVEVVIGGEGEATAEEAVAEDGSASETVVNSSTYQLYDVNSAITFETGYKGMKDLIQLIASDTQRKSVGTLSATFNAETGKLSGNMTYDTYFVYGLDKPYMEPEVPAMEHGIKNIFGTVNAEDAQ